MFCDTKEDRELSVKLSPGHARLSRPALPGRGWQLGRWEAQALPVSLFTSGPLDSPAPSGPSFYFRVVRGTPGKRLHACLDT